MFWTVIGSFDMTLVVKFNKNTIKRTIYLINAMAIKLIWFDITLIKWINPVRKKRLWIIKPTRCPIWMKSQRWRFLLIELKLAIFPKSLMKVATLAPYRTALPITYFKVSSMWQENWKSQLTRQYMFLSLY